MPKKSCPNCNENCGPRTIVCKKCGHKFLVKEKQIKVIDSQHRFSDDDSGLIVKNSPEFGEEVVIKRIVSTPAGEPPFSPKGSSDREVIEWANKIKEWGRSYGEEYSTEAIIYWCRYFWDMFSEEFSRISLVLRNNLTPTRVDDDLMSITISMIEEEIERMDIQNG